MNVIKEILLVSLILCLTATAPSVSLQCRPIKESVCKDIGIKEMRVPNFLNHNNVTEIYKELREWQPLISSGCHEGLTKFLCSLYTPVCLKEAEIKPCKSLCEDVKKNCEPLMNIRNYLWPKQFQCNKYEENSMCIRHESNATTTRPSITRPSTRICKTSSLNVKEVQKLYCRSDFAVKGKVLETKANRDNSQLIVKIEILKYLRRTRPGRRKGNLFKVRVPLTNPRNCNAYSKRPYLIIRKQRGKKATAVVLKWRKYRRLHKAARCSN